MIFGGLEFVVAKLLFSKAGALLAAKVATGVVAGTITTAAAVTILGVAGKVIWTASLIERVGNARDALSNGDIKSATTILAKFAISQAISAGELDSELKNGLSQHSDNTHAIDQFVNKVKELTPYIANEMLRLKQAGDNDED